TGGDPTLIFNSAAANRQGIIKFQDNGTNVGRIDYVHNGDRIDIQAGSATGATMSIKNGAVGIGTNTPGALLDLETPGNTVDGTYYSTATINNTGSSTYSGVRFDRSAVAKWRVGIMPDDTFHIAKLYNTADDGAFVIDSSGNVGIGTAAPNAPLTVWTASSATSLSALRLNNPGGFSSATAGCEIIFSQDRSTSEDYRMAAISSSQQYTGSSAGGELKFWTRNSSSITEKVRLHANGVLAASAGIALGSGLANTAANTLDDYEEGTWTPTVAFNNVASGVTYSVQVGRYTKVGRMVYSSFNILLTSKGTSTGGVTVKGSPFANYTAVQNNAGTVICESSGVDWPQNGVYGMIWSDSSIYLRSQGTTAYSNVNNTHLSNTTRIFGMMVYEVA
ncbi:MAG: hypothetical protein ACKVJK_23120, partial [Methylophagaceae bacterium]